MMNRAVSAKMSEPTEDWPAAEAAAREEACMVVVIRRELIGRGGTNPLSIHHSYGSELLLLWRWHHWLLLAVSMAICHDAGPYHVVEEV